MNQSIDGSQKEEKKIYQGEKKVFPNMRRMQEGFQICVQGDQTRLNEEPTNRTPLFVHKKTFVWKIQI